MKYVTGEFSGIVVQYATGGRLTRAESQCMMMLSEFFDSCA